MRVAFYRGHFSNQTASASAQFALAGHLSSVKSLIVPRGITQEALDFGAWNFMDSRSPAHFSLKGNFSEIGLIATRGQTRAAYDAVSRIIAPMLLAIRPGTWFGLAQRTGPAKQQLEGCVIDIGACFDI
jgi:hypothetical protein